MKSNQKSDKKWRNSSDSFPPPAWKQQELTLILDVPSQESLKSAVTGGIPTNFSPSAKGDYVEHLAICWLYEQGYEVFRNCSCVGDVDMIATKGSSVVKIDVKTLCVTYHYGKPYWQHYCSKTPSQKEQNVRFLLFHPENKTFVFSDSCVEPKN